MATATDPTGLDVRVPNPEFMDNYDTGASEFVPPPQPKEIQPNGRPKYFQFVAQAPTLDKISTKDKDGKVLTTKEGWLKAVIEGIKLVESGYTFGQTHIGTGQYKKYDRKTNQPTGEFRNASPAIDYFHAHGIELKPSTVEEYQEYFQATAERQFQVTTDWSAYDKDTQSDVASKWEDFPDASTDLEAFGKFYPGQDPTGKKLPYVERAGKRFWARAQIKRYVSVVEGKK
jgi:hypothetical protein